MAEHPSLDDLMAKGAAVRKRLREMDDVEMHMIAGEVVAAKKRIRSEQHTGNPIDKAIYAVAEERHEDWRVVLGAYRRIHPLKGQPPPYSEKGL